MNHEQFAGFRPFVFWITLLAILQAVLIVGALS